MSIRESLKREKFYFGRFAKVYAREIQKFREFFRSQKFLLLKYTNNTQTARGEWTILHIQSNWILTMQILSRTFGSFVDTANAFPSWTKKRRNKIITSKCEKTNKEFSYIFQIYVA